VSAARADSPGAPRKAGGRGRRGRFLASPQAGYITGTPFHVKRGMYMKLKGRDGTAWDGRVPPLVRPLVLPREQRTVTESRSGFDRLAGRERRFCYNAHLLNFDCSKTRGKEPAMENVEQRGQENRRGTARRERSGDQERILVCRRPRRGLARHPSNS